MDSGSEVQSSEADGPASVAVPSTSAAETAPVLVDVKLLATMLNQARGPILTRIRQLANPFTGDGSEDISEWLGRYEGYCRVENISPTDLLVYMLGGNAARVYSRMIVGDASQWDVVKGALLAEYAIPRQEAWRKFVSCRMEEGDTVDTFLDRLERFGRRVGMSCNDLSFRAQFYEGLPPAIHEWAVTHDHAYTADFGSVLARVRDKVVSRRAVASRSKVGQGVVAATASGRQQPGSNACYRCGGPHKVKDCTTRRKAPSAKGPRKSGCFRCGSIEHYISSCPQAAAAVGAQDFLVGGADRGGVPPPMEIE